MRKILLSKNSFKSPVFGTQNIEGLNLEISYKCSSFKTTCKMKVFYGFLYL